ncbi:MAG TPA: phage/plasmid primase, P4 family [Acidimicrobiales bacterium]|nr:phage/plasmid primase, P4 family [Acidimicrobiales bacterium]
MNDHAADDERGDPLDDLLASAKRPPGGGEKQTGKTKADSRAVLHVRAETFLASPQGKHLLRQQDGDNRGRWWVYDKDEGTWSIERGFGADGKMEEVHPDLVAGDRAAVLRELWNKLRVLPERNFDADPWKLCCKNGVADLSTGEVLPHSPDHRVTRTTRVDFDPDHPGADRWERLFTEWLDGDAESVGYVRRYFGLTLVGGMPRDKSFLVVQGKTNTGKTVAENGLMAALGDYARVTQPSTFTVGDDAITRYSLAEFVGRRCIIAHELERGARLKSSLLKTVTGEEPLLEARSPGGRPFSYPGQFMVIMFTNYDPPAVGDKAVEGRMRVVRFVRQYVTREEKDPGLRPWASSPEGGAAFLAWAYRGLQEWDAEGRVLVVPTQIDLDSAEAAAGSDAIGRFLEDVLEPEPVKSNSVPCKDLKAVYARWCRQELLPVMRGDTFSLALRERDIVSQKLNGHWRYVEHKGQGLRLRDGVSVPTASEEGW